MADKCVGRPRIDCFPIDKAIELYSTGISVLEVARLIRYSRGTTRRRLIEAGVLKVREKDLAKLERLKEEL